MTTVGDLTARNASFASAGFERDLTINPGGNVMVIGCVDPRVDPGHVLGLANGEAAIIRNVGGRVTPATLRTMAMLSKVGQANAETRRPGPLNLVLLHHTDCGMNDLAAFPGLLAEYFETTVDELDAKSVTDPVGSVRTDVEVIRQSIHAPDYLVSGLVYDVRTGAVEVVVPPTQVPID
ncbi:carbonic anhydrase [Mycolicibacterium madagascariense]|uniref:carbonic anhydrase n=1 Tax=Mycolicibacterium madagascariense TaxID=212765 RepID=A0A7I7X9V6_9MYCO|nr:carbonic anhydrase [Mycolicibacterium madagascariense]MCV7012883.1 carbonic anhydrase [Mycolicibacterium madagascariense]BBZ26130.1 carbonic anhydrase [Mycolicibacterium madagascariense]